MSRVESLREQVAARRRELREEGDSLALTVAAWPDTFQVRYRLLGDDESDKFSKPVEKAQRQKSNALARKATLDVLIASCDCILVEGADGEWEPLTDDDDEPMAFGPALGQLLEIDDETMAEGGARAVATEFFSPGGKFPDAIFVHAEALGKWRRGLITQIDRELLGE